MEQVLASKAVLYSEDEASKPTGGKYTLNRKTTTNGKRV